MDDSHTKMDDSHAKVDDSHAKVDDNHAKVNDCHAKVDDSHAKVDDSPAKVDDSHARLQMVYRRSGDGTVRSPARGNIRPMGGHHSGTRSAPKPIETRTPKPVTHGVSR
eukprot:635564-Prorocentrum_minimum.AAC.2